VMPVVLEAHAGTKVGDLLALYDAVVAAGFPSVQCVRASERAPWRALIEEPPPPPPPPPPPGKRNAGK